LFVVGVVVFVLGVVVVFVLGVVVVFVLGVVVVFVVLFDPEVEFERVPFPPRVVKFWQDTTSK